MKQIYTVIIVLLISGCSATPKLDSINGVNQSEASYRGTITAVSYERKSSLMEDFGSFMVGSAVGYQFGKGEGQDIMGTIGGVAASEIYEQKFANEYTKLSVRTQIGDYPVYVKGHLKLNPGRKVKVSIDHQKITGISLLGRATKQISSFMDMGSAECIIGGEIS